MSVEQSGLRVGKSAILEAIQERVKGAQRLSLEEYSALVDQVMEMADQQFRLMCSVVLLLLLVLTVSCAYPLAHPNQKPQPTVVDGFYWAIVTFTTVGLGDLTWDYADDKSTHGKFDFLPFLLLSSGLALLAAVIQNGVQISRNLMSIVGMMNGMMSCMVVPPN